MNKIYVLLIIILSLLIWGPVLNQVPMGEGYYYFDTIQRFNNPIFSQTSLKQYDNFARIIFDIFTPIFGDRIELYMILQVAITVFLFLTFYTVLFLVSQNKLFAFLVTVLFLSNHTGLFSMMAIGNYQRFVQRVPNLFFVFTSYLFLIKYLDNKKIKDAIYFGILYLLALYLSHHSIFMLPLFIVFIFIKSLTSKFATREKLTEIILFLFVIISSLLLTRTDHFVPKEGMIEFIRNTPNIIDKTLLQIPNMLIPTELVRSVAKNWPIMPIPYPFTFVLKIFLLPILILLVLPILLVKGKGNTKLLYITALISLPIVCFLNLYAYGDGAPHPLRDFGEDRIYFIPSIYGSIVVGYLFIALWNTKNKIAKSLAFAIFITSIIYNKLLINKDSLKYNYAVSEMKTFISYVKLNTTDKNVKVAIIGPSHLLWPTQFVDLYYNTNNNLALHLDSSSWNEIIDRSKYNKIVLLDYIDGKLLEKQIK